MHYLDNMNFTKLLPLDIHVINIASARLVYMFVDSVLKIRIPCLLTVCAFLLKFAKLIDKK